MNHLSSILAQKAASGVWNLFQSINTRLPEGKPLHPKWAPGPLLKSYQRSMPPLGFPRETDSLCPECVKEVRNAIIRGERDLSELIHGHPGEIKAHLLEENGQIIIRKTCEVHGTFEDLISIDPEFTRIIESRYPGRDFRTLGDELIHRHGTSSIKYGRGAVLTIDLTNRCNMMCNPCFMDANQVGYVHELTMDDVKRILDASISFKPRRQMSVQYSGGEPTLSPIFLDACRYAKKIGYYSVQAATNGLRFALEPEFAFKAKEAGLDMVYFQFDGVTNEANQHRHITNLFDAKLLAIENLSKAGIDITPVTTVVRTVNDDQVGPILQFLIDNCDRMGGVSFQPVSFTGRDEDIPDELRRKQRYTISHLARELQRWSNGEIDMYRDWYPLGVGSAFTILADYLRGPDITFGGLSCSCHPDCGSSVYLLANTRTKVWAPVTKFFNIDQFIQDIRVITDTARSPELIKAQALLSIVRNFDASKAPAGFDLAELGRMINSKLGGSFTGGKRPPKSEWRFLWVGGMWFQDLWTYDFRRTEMCVIPYGTQEGEISFCAYNTGVGWRQIIENMHKTATTAEWFKTRGRHKIYAGNRPMPLPKVEHTVKLPVLNNASAENGNGCGCASGLQASIQKILSEPAEQEAAEA
ncbi:MAG: radical SAM protein [Calditrichaeota bacterium]|nr:MAG: radical SAM protein [Calditrichota bacterium]